MVATIRRSKGQMRPNVDWPFVPPFVFLVSFVLRFFPRTVGKKSNVSSTQMNAHDYPRSSVFICG